MRAGETGPIYHKYQAGTERSSVADATGGGALSLPI